MPIGGMLNVFLSVTVPEWNIGKRLCLKIIVINTAFLKFPILPVQKTKD